MVDIGYSKWSIFDYLNVVEVCTVDGFNKSELVVLVITFKTLRRNRLMFGVLGKVQRVWSRD